LMGYRWSSSQMPQIVLLGSSQQHATRLLWRTAGCSSTRSQQTMFQEKCLTSLHIEPRAPRAPIWNHRPQCGISVLFPGNSG
jgi:hypothetical protein